MVSYGNPEGLSIVPRVDSTLAKDWGWWALYTRHQHEKAVAETLSEKGFEVFLPLYESTRQWKDRSKQISLPLFPGYVFVRESPERRSQVVTTRGVHMILSRGDKAETIPESEIGAIRLALKGPNQVEPHPFLESGQWVRIKQGPLEGLGGVVVRRKNSYRLVLSVQMLAQSVAIEIDAVDVESAAA